MTLYPVSSNNTALIPYMAPKSLMEFISFDPQRKLNIIIDKLEQFVFQYLFPPSYLFHLSQLDFINRNAQQKLIASILFSETLMFSSYEISSSRPVLVFETPIYKTVQYYETSDKYNAAFSAPYYKKLNGDEIAEALTGEAVFTIATDKKPIVATYGASPCVALGGYDETNKIAFIVHFSIAEQVDKYRALIFGKLYKLANQKIEKPIQLHLRGGMKGQSDALVADIKSKMMLHSNFPMEIASEDILNSDFMKSKDSLSIDSRTGQVSEYSPSANPKARDQSRIDEIRAILRGLYVVYEPNKNE